MNVIIARYGEVHLKGANRGIFMRALTENLVRAVGKECTVSLAGSRYIFDGFASEQTDFLLQKIASVFGIVSASPCAVTGHDGILKYLAGLKISGTFKCEINRADKTFPKTSMEFACDAGAVILENNADAHVDVHNPDKIIYVDIRENNRAFIYGKVVPAVGGMPVGTAGRALALLSGGIDSPAAVYLAAKRGLNVDCVHFASPPYTSEMALDKVRRLCEKLTGYCGNIRVYVVPFTEIQQQIKARCDEQYLITIMRRFMVRLAEKIALDNRIDCLITGENLAQVASQTIAGITTNNVCARTVPVLRPLITYDKSEIIALAKKIDTYDISIEPHADCCTVFVPSSPVIKPTVKKCEREEQNLDVDGLLKNALAGVYIL